MDGQSLSSPQPPQCHFADAYAAFQKIYEWLQCVTFVEYIPSRTPVLYQLQLLLYYFNFLFQRKWNFYLFTHTQSFLAHVLPQSLCCLLTGVPHKTVCHLSQFLLIDVTHLFEIILVSAEICLIVLYAIESHWNL